MAQDVKVRELFRQSGALDMRRHIKLCVNTFTFRYGMCQFVGVVYDAILHKLYLVIEVADLVI